MIKFRPLGLPCVLLLLLSSSVSADAESKKNEIKIDESADISVGFQDGSWKVYPSVLSWTAHDSTILAVGTFVNSQQEDGWMRLEVKTKEGADDALQAKAAGLAEGYLTRTYIVEQYKEFYANDVCSTNAEMCEWIFQKFRENTDFTTEMARLEMERDPFWYQVHLFYQQMDGIRQGYQLKSLDGHLNDSGMHDELGVLLLNFIADFWDMADQWTLLNATDSDAVNFGPKSRPSCSVIIKHDADQGELFFGHNTWHEYRAMGYRVLKSYQINVHTLPDRAVKVPGHTITMSSYAGSLMSLDDFYLTSAGLAATETTLFIFNKELLRNLPKESVMEPFRVMVANRLATTGKEWADIFKRWNSGTYNNEWMVADYNKFKESPKELLDGVFTVTEQIPGLVITEDQTGVLRNKTYWGSYNRAFYPEIAERVGQNEKVKQFGDWFTHDKTNRANIMRRDHHKVKDLPSLMEFLRYNDFENDEFGTIAGCQPAANPAGSLSNRLDLYHMEGKCDFDEVDWMVVRSGYGALDTKVASSTSFPSLEFLAVAGPTRGNGGSSFPPFAWSTTKLEKKPAFRPIDEFDFQPVRTGWGLNSATAASSTLKNLAFLQAAIHAVVNFKRPI